MLKHKVTPKTLPTVLLKFAAFCIQGDRYQQQAICYSLNHFLNELVSEDVFGTEAQCDPRGDQRE